MKGITLKNDADMPTDVSEKGLETILVDYLRDVHGYEQAKTMR